MIQDILALILSGGRTGALGILDQKRTKSAIPFGGSYRLIDFPLSNLANSGIRRVGVLTQYRPASLIEHINFGKPWDLVGRSREVRVLPPYTGEDYSSWYKGTIDAVYQNQDFIETYAQDDVLILSGEHIYNLNFNKVYEFHKNKKADITIVTVRMDKAHLTRFGIVEVDKESRVVGFEEKPVKAKTNLISMTIYLFKKDILLKEIRSDAKQKGSTHNFAVDLLPELIKKYNVYSYEYEGHWYYLGNIEEYWMVSMMMLDKHKINPELWGIRTNVDDRKIADRMPAFISRSSKIKNSIISRGCWIKGEVINSIIFPGVVVDKDAKIVDSIIMHDTKIGEYSRIERSVIDKDVSIGANVLVGVGANVPNIRFPKDYNSGISVVGKGVSIPKSVSVGKNCLVYDGARKSSFKDNVVVSGACVYKR